MFTSRQAEILDRLLLIPYYPKEQHHLVLEEIYQFARGGSDERLLWLAQTAIRDMREWAGAGELRGLWCTRFQPADGVEADCSLAGHTPGDIEAENLIRHEQLKALEKSDQRSHARLLPVKKIDYKPN